MLRNILFRFCNDKLVIKRASCVSQWSGLKVQCCSYGVCKRNSSVILTRCLTSGSSSYSQKGSFNDTLNNILIEMPKEVNVKELHGIRLAKRVRVRKYMPNTVYLQVVGTGAEGAPKSLYVFTEHSRYIFNCGEGMQRLAQEHKVKMSMTEHVFVTHKSWANIGGLMGLLLTLQDMGVPDVTIHAPPGIESLYKDTRNFLKYRDISVKFRHYLHNDGIFSGTDYPLWVKCVPIWAKPEPTLNPCLEPIDQEFGRESSPVEDLFAHEKTVKLIPISKKFFPVRTNRPSNVDHEEQMVESEKCRSLALAYICRPPPKAGTLLLERCVLKGVPPGPLLGELKQGKDVTLPNGTFVKASEVTEPDEVGGVFIVVDIPNESYLEALLETTEFMEYQSNACKEDRAEIIVHFTQTQVAQSEMYQKWMGRFGPGTKHMFVNGDDTYSGYESLYRSQFKLNLLSEQLFPMLAPTVMPVRRATKNELTGKGVLELGSDNVDDVKLASETAEAVQFPWRSNFALKLIDNALKFANQNADDLQLNNTIGLKFIKSTNQCEASLGEIIQAEPMMIYHLRPKKPTDRSVCPFLVPEEYIKECFDNAKFENQLNLAKSVLQELKVNVSYYDVTDYLASNVTNVSHTDATNDVSNTKDEFPNVIFLGTGSSISNKTRNTSGILLNICTDKCIIMDCGEGTFGQLLRFYGPTATDVVLRRLTAVYVSHLHADHHLGLISILEARAGAFLKEEVKEIPELLLLAPQNIRAYLLSYHLHCAPILSHVTLIANHGMRYDARIEKRYEHVCSSLGMKEVVTAVVHHCGGSFGVALTHQDGWKIVYSGDTMPCDALVEIGKGCDLLIHEATMEDYLMEDAKLKRHSTVSQALQIGKEMSAGHILLTHFSQRYSKIPLLGNNRPLNSGIAFDNMKVRLKDLPSLYHLYPAILEMFSEEYEELLQKTEKRKKMANLLKVEEQERAEAMWKRQKMNETR